MYHLSRHSQSILFFKFLSTVCMNFTLSHFPLTQTNISFIIEKNEIDSFTIMKNLMLNAMKDYLSEQKNYVNEIFVNLSSITEESASAKEPMKWSKKEIIGHLIDSASNNHQRFVRAQFKDDLIFPGYDQDEWVEVQDYQKISWQSLISLWKEFNLLIIHVSERIPEHILRQLREAHNLDSIAWKEIPAERPATLEYFIRDYFGHLRHHLDRIFA